MRFAELGSQSAAHYQLHALLIVFIWWCTGRNQTRVLKSFLSVPAISRQHWERCRGISRHLWGKMSPQQGESTTLEQVCKLLVNLKQIRGMKMLVAGNCRTCGEPRGSEGHQEPTQGGMVMGSNNMTAMQTLKHAHMFGGSAKQRRFWARKWLSYNHGQAGTLSQGGKGLQGIPLLLEGHLPLPTPEAPVRGASSLLLQLPLGLTDPVLPCPGVSRRGWGRGLCTPSARLNDLNSRPWYA